LGPSAGKRDHTAAIRNPLAFLKEETEFTRDPNQEEGEKTKKTKGGGVQVSYFRLNLHSNEGCTPSEGGQRLKLDNAGGENLKGKVTRPESLQVRTLPFSSHREKK